MAVAMTAAGIASSNFTAAARSGATTGTYIGTSRFAAASWFSDTAAWFASYFAAARVTSVALTLEVMQQVMSLVLGCTEQLMQGLATWLAAAGVAARCTSGLATAARAYAASRTTSVFNSAARANAASVFAATARSSTASRSASVFAATARADAASVFNSTAGASATAGVAAGAVTARTAEAEHAVQQTMAGEAWGTEASAEYQRSNKHVPFHRVTTPKR